MTRAERRARRQLFLAERNGDEAGADQARANLTRALHDQYDAGPIESSSSRSSVLDRHPAIVVGTTVVASAVVGVRLNKRYGPVTPLALQPSTLGGAGALALGVVARQLGYRKTARLALAAAVGQGIATVAAHVPEGALMGPRTPTV